MFGEMKIVIKQSANPKRRMDETSIYYPKSDGEWAVEPVKSEGELRQRLVDIGMGETRAADLVESLKSDDRPVRVETLQSG
jgi:hypothetical protein